MAFHLNKLYSQHAAYPVNHILVGLSDSSQLVGLHFVAIVMAITFVVEQVGVKYGS
jgi:hypothetical protein